MSYRYLLRGKNSREISLNNLYLSTWLIWSTTCRYDTWIKIVYSELWKFNKDKIEQGKVIRFRLWKMGFNFGWRMWSIVVDGDVWRNLVKGLRVVVIWFIIYWNRLTVDISCWEVFRILLVGKRILYSLYIALHVSALPGILLQPSASHIELKIWVS